MRSPSRYQSTFLEGFVTLTSLTSLVGTLPTRQLLSLWMAVFSTFSMVGFSMDLLNEGRQPIVRLAMNAVSSGAFLTLFLRLSLPVRKGRLGYTMFLYFINSTAARYLRAQAEIAVSARHSSRSRTGRRLPDRRLRVSRTLGRQW